MSSRALDLIGSHAFQSGYLSGYLAGLDRGREQADAEAAAMHHRAWRVVQAAASIPSHADLVALRRRNAEEAAARHRAAAEPWVEPQEVAS